MKLSKTYDHAIDENTPAWSTDAYGRPIHPRVKALDDAVVFLCAASGCSSSDISDVRLALGQMCERDKVPMQDWQQLTERTPMTIRYLATYKGLSLKSTLDMIRAGDLGFEDIEGALKTRSINYEIKEFKGGLFYKRIIERENLNSAMSDFNNAISKDVERIVTSKYFNHVLAASLILFIGAAIWEIFS